MEDVVDSTCRETNSSEGKQDGDFLKTVHANVSFVSEDFSNATTFDDTIISRKCE
jgi:hypothetical protein